MINSKLKNIILYVMENSVFYDNIYSKYIAKEGIDNIEFEELPVIKKEEIYNYMLRILSKKWHTDYVNNSLIKFTTSGSTGICLDIYWSEQDYIDSLLGLWYLRKKYYDINTTDLVCTFYSNRNHKNYEPKQMRIKNCLSFSKSNLDENRLLEIYSEIRKFKPKYMIVEPSIAILLCEYMKKNNLEEIESIKYIELTGEILLPNVKKKIEKSFGCVTANQYGAYEVNSIAYECPEGNMHIMDKNVLVEVVDKEDNTVKDGEEGDICITSLTNSVMPFIRYKIGDRGRICTDIKCTCGNFSKILKLTNGRSNDYIICENGEKIHSSVFMKLIEKINIRLKNVISQYQIHQLDYNKFIFKLVLS